jgi:hypothetical protein
MDYRSFVHRPEQLVGAAPREGVRLTYEHDGPLWRVAGFERPT